MTDTVPESSPAITARPPPVKIAASTSALPIASGAPTRLPVATSQIPTVPASPWTAIRFESGLKEIDCAPDPLLEVALFADRDPVAYADPSGQRAVGNQSVEDRDDALVQLERVLLIPPTSTQTSLPRASSASTRRAAKTLSRRE
jgi:hypothetical protein